MRRIPNAPPRVRCQPCAHRLAYGSCGAPVAAGLSDAVGVVVWAPVGHLCAAYLPRR